MKSISGLPEVIDRYDAVLLDLWGVVHDGSHLYPGVHDILAGLKKSGKKIIMLSNAPRRAAKVETVLNQLGVEKELYDGVMSSGEAGYQWLKDGKAPWGKRYYYIGPGKDADVLDGLDYQRVDDIKQADFLLNVGFGSEHQSSEDFMPLLRASKAQGLPMLCLNPDMEVVKQTGECFPCAGVIGEQYERLGGKVTWFGKPYPAVYEHCMAILGNVPKKRVLVVGDSLGTDIAGGQNSGFDSLLITGGILKKKKPEEITALCGTHKVTPTYVMPSLQGQAISGPSR